MGVLGFIPSEQARGRSVLASDIYALGLTAIYWLTGKTPDKLDSDPMTGEILWHQYATHISPQLCQILDKAIQPNANDRYANASAMLADLCPQTVIILAETHPFDFNLVTGMRSFICYGIVGLGILV